MKATELRIFNLIDRHGVMEVRAINNHGEIRPYDHVNKFLQKAYYPASSFNGIPLTEEWLVKFVWQLVRGNEYHINSYFSIIGTGLYYMNDFTGINIPYVHTLQNLIHALTGEEPKLK